MGLTVCDELEERAVRVAEVHARPGSAAPHALDGAELDLDAVCEQVGNRRFGRSVPDEAEVAVPGMHGVDARGTGLEPGPCTFSCCPSASR